MFDLWCSLAFYFFVTHKNGKLKFLSTITCSSFFKCRHLLGFIRFSIWLLLYFVELCHSDAMIRNWQPIFARQYSCNIDDLVRHAYFINCSRSWEATNFMWMLYSCPLPWHSRDSLFHIHQLEDRHLGVFKPPQLLPTLSPFAIHPTYTIMLSLPLAFSTASDSIIVFCWHK